MHKQKLTGPIELASKSISIFKKKYRVLVPIALISGILGVLSISAEYAASGDIGPFQPIFLLFGLVGIIAFIIQIWSAAALTYATVNHSKKISISKALAKGWSLFAPYIIVSIVSGLIVLGGLILFIIPGLIFMTWFAFSTIIVVAEKKKAIPAIKQSKSYVKGRAWEVFGRLIFLVAAVIVASIVISIILEILTFSPLLQESITQLLISIFLAPLSVLYLFLLYQDLKN